MESLKNIRAFDIKFITVDQKVFSDLPLLDYIPTLDCYSRLYIPWINPNMDGAEQTVERAVWRYLAIFRMDLFPKSAADAIRKHGKEYLWKLSLHACFLRYWWRHPLFFAHPKFWRMMRYKRLANETA